MANDAKAAVAAAVETMASDMGRTWDSALNWAATTEALIEMIADIGNTIDQVQLATLLGAAAMARRQSLRAAPETEA